MVQLFPFLFLYFLFLLRFVLLKDYLTYCISPSTLNKLY